MAAAGGSRVKNLIRTVDSKWAWAYSPNAYLTPNGKSLQTTTAPTTDYAFEMACSNIRYGVGVTQEVGMDLANMKAKKVGVYTDKTVGGLPGHEDHFGIFAKKQHQL